MTTAWSFKPQNTATASYKTKNSTSFTYQVVSMGDFFLLMEDGFYLLLEDGGKIILESSVVGTTDWNFHTKS